MNPFSRRKYHGYPPPNKKGGKNAAGRSILLWTAFLCCTLLYMRSRCTAILFPAGENGTNDQQLQALHQTKPIASSSSSKLQELSDVFQKAVEEKIDYYNQQPDSEKHQLTSMCSPDLRSCSCYASWLNLPEEDVCNQMRAAADADNIKPQLKVATTKGWFSAIFMRKDDKNAVTTFDCPASVCHISHPTDDVFDSEEWDGLISFFGCDQGSFPNPKYPQSKPWFKNGFVMEEPYHLSADYMRRPGHDADIAMTYVHPDGMPDDEYIRTALAEHPAIFFSKFKPPNWVDRKFTISAMTGMCYPERQSLVNEISSKIKVLQFGKCDKTAEVKDVLPECANENWRPEQRCLASHFKFHLSFENSQLHGYVTEKLWNVMVNGVIPIYHGAPDIDDFLPDKDSIIRVSDFKSIDKLVEYINHLLESPAAYKKHMAWRDKPLPQHFIDYLTRDSISAAPCRYCDQIAELKQKILLERGEAGIPLVNALAAGTIAAAQ